MLNVHIDARGQIQNFGDRFWFPLTFIVDGLTRCEG